MHTLAVTLAPVLAAEKSKVPFYVAGGLLVVWALTVSLVLGLRRADFPGDLRGQRTVSAISAVLVLVAVSTAVLTSGSPTKSSAASPGPAAAQAYNQSAPPAPAPGGEGGAPAAPAQAGTSAAAAPAATPTAPAPATSTAPAPATTPSKAPAAATAPAAAASLKLAANAGGQLSYDAKTLAAKAGGITIAFTNASPVEHNVTVAQGATVLGATPTFTGGSRPLTLKLAAGTYTFYCSVPGHRQAGMEGTLTVK